MLKTPHSFDIYQTIIHPLQNIAKGTIDPIEYCDSFNTFSSKQKLQQALNSWSNFSLVLSGKGREIQRTSMKNPINNLSESMYHLREIYVSILTTEKNPNNFDKSKNLSKIRSDGFSDYK